MQFEEKDVYYLKEYQDIMNGILANIENKLVNHARKNEILDLCVDLVRNAKLYYMDLGKMQLLKNLKMTENVSREHEKLGTKRVPNETIEMLDLKGKKEKVISCDDKYEARRVIYKLKQYVKSHKLNVSIHQNDTKVIVKEKS